MDRRRRIKSPRKSANTHISLITLKEYLKHGVYPNSSTPSDKRSLRKRSESFKIINGELYYVVRPKPVEGEPSDLDPRENVTNYRKAILTPKEQLSVASTVHVQGNHMGTERTLTLLSSQFYWLGMATTVRKVLKSCVVCLANRPALSSKPSQDGDFDFTQSLDLDDALLLPKSTSIAKMEEMEVASGEREEKTIIGISESDGSFIVKEELAEPDGVDADLDYSPDITYPSSIFSSKINVHKSARFWQMVEFQIYGPFTHKRRQHFVLAALDTYSKWPEVQTVETCDEQTVAHFCLKLIARYGMMDHFVVMENAVTEWHPLDEARITRNLAMLGVKVCTDEHDPYDSDWARLHSTITHFVEAYPEVWLDCLELCLLPVRNSVSQAADYTPAYLLLNREPSFPVSVLPNRRQLGCEMSLSEEKVRHSVDTMVSIYQQCCALDSSEAPGICTTTPSTPGKIASRSKQGSDRSRRQLSKKVPGRVKRNNVKQEEVLAPSSARIDEISKKDITSRLVSEGTENSIVFSHIDVPEDNTLTLEILEKKYLDTFYKLIYMCKSEGCYPVNSTVTFREMLKTSATSFDLKGGKMFHQGKFVVMTLKERLDLMRQTHISDGIHVASDKVLDELTQQEVFWQDMAEDVKAFVVACPGCKFGEEKKKKERRKEPIKQLRWNKAGVLDDEEDSDSNTRDGSLTHSDLWLYIKKGVTPDTLSRSQLLLFRKRARNFKIEKGTLFYSPSHFKKGDMRRMLKTDKEKEEAVLQAHLTGSDGKHLDLKSTQEVLKLSVFWFGMTEDISKFLKSCDLCRTSVALDDDKGQGEEEMGKLDLAQAEKIRLYQDYFAEKDLSRWEDNFQVVFSSQVTEQLVEAEATKLKAGETLMAHAGHKDTEGQMGGSNTPADGQLKDLDCEDPNEGELAEVEREGTEEKKARARQILAENEHREKAGRSTTRVRKRCEVCLKVIVGENNYKAHMYTHTGLKAFECSLCHKKFTNVKGLRIHMRKHTGHRPFLCSICGRGFLRSSSLHYHLKTHERSMRSDAVTCDICQRVFTCTTRLTKHKQYKHPVEAPVFECHDCGKRFTVKRSLKRHKETHLGIRNFQCPHCSRSFFRKEYLNYHLMTHIDLDPSLQELHAKLKARRAKQVPKKKFQPALFTLAVGQEMSHGQAGEDEQEYSHHLIGWAQNLQRDQHQEPVVLELAPDGTLISTNGGERAVVMVDTAAPTQATTHSSSAAGSIADASVLDVAEVESQQIMPPTQQTHQSHQVMPPTQHIVSPTQHIVSPTQHIVSPTQHIMSPTQQRHQSAHVTPPTQQKHQSQHQKNVTSERTLKGPSITLTIEEDLEESHNETHHHYHDHHHNHQQQQQQQQQLHTEDPEVIDLPQEIISFAQQQQEQQLGMAGEASEPRTIEILLPSGATHTMILPGVGGAGVTEPTADGATLQYQVECQPGQILTEDDINAIRMLAQASLRGGTTQLLQQ